MRLRVFTSLDRAFPTTQTCPRCEGSGIGYQERGSRFQPSYAEDCGHCNEGRIYSPKARLISRKWVLHIQRNRNQEPRLRPGPIHQQMKGTP